MASASVSNVSAESGCFPLNTTISEDPVFEGIGLGLGSAIILACLSIASWIQWRTGLRRQYIYKLVSLNSLVALPTGLINVLPNCQFSACSCAVQGFFRYYWSLAAVLSMMLIGVHVRHVRRSGILETTEGPIFRAALFVLLAPALLALGFLGDHFGPEAMYCGLTDFDEWPNVVFIAVCLVSCAVTTWAFLVVYARPEVRDAPAVAVPHERRPSVPSTNTLEWPLLQSKVVINTYTEARQQLQDDHNRPFWKAARHRCCGPVFVDNVKYFCLVYTICHLASASSRLATLGECGNHVTTAQAYVRMVAFAVVPIANAILFFTSPAVWERPPASPEPALG